MSYKQSKNTPNIQSAIILDNKKENILLSEELELVDVLHFSLKTKQPDSFSLRHLNHEQTFCFRSIKV